VTRRRRPRDWNEAGTRQRLHEVPLAELNTVAKLDSSRCVIDTVSLRAARGGLTGPTPTGDFPGRATQHTSKFRNAF
jgi:hypothetical protein